VTRIDEQNVGTQQRRPLFEIEFLQLARDDSTRKSRTVTPKVGINGNNLAWVTVVSIPL
jgi:hypothetical protein